MYEAEEKYNAAVVLNHFKLRAGRWAGGARFADLHVNLAQFGKHRLSCMVLEHLTERNPSYWFDKESDTAEVVNY